MKIGELVVGLIVLVMAALLLADGVLTNMGTELFSLSIVKLLIGFVLVVLAGSHFQKVKE